MQEELKKERSQVEELREAQSGLEKERSRLCAELKSLAGKSEKVSCWSNHPTPMHFIILVIMQGVN